MSTELNVKLLWICGTTNPQHLDEVMAFGLYFGDVNRQSASVC